MPNSVLLYLHSFPLSRLNKVYSIKDCHSCTLFAGFNDFTDGSLARDGRVPQRGKGEGRGPAGVYSHPGPPGPILSPEARFTRLRWM